jgi:hypothetical protein
MRLRSPASGPLNSPSSALEAIVSERAMGGRALLESLSSITDGILLFAFWIS